MTATFGATRAHGAQRPAQRPQWARVARQLARVLAEQTIWFWGICLSVVIAATLVLERMELLEISILQFLRHGAIWYPFAMFLVYVLVDFALHVTSGMTRQSFVRATLLLAVGMGAGYAVIMSAARIAERATNPGNVAPAPEAGIAADLAPMVAGYALAFTAGAVCGLLVGISYARYGAIWGSLSLLLTVPPVIVVMQLTESPVEQPAELAGAHAAISLALVAAAAAAYAMLARRAPVRASVIGT